MAGKIDTNIVRQYRGGSGHKQLKQSERDSAPDTLPCLHISPLGMPHNCSSLTGVSELHGGCNFSQQSPTTAYSPSAGPERTRLHSSRVNQTHNNRYARLVIAEVDRTVEHYFSQGLAPSSQKVYAAGIKRYNDFCSQFRLRSLPATELVLCHFVAMLARDNIAHASLRVYLSAVRQLHLESGHEPPNTGAMARLQQVLKGIRIAQSKDSQIVPRQRAPITLEMLAKIKATWDKKVVSPDMVMLWAAFLTCFYGCMRFGELCGQESDCHEQTADINYEDVTVDNITNPQRVQLLLRKSKTDIFRQGTTIHIGRTDGKLCPVAALLSWMICRGSRLGQLFLFASGKVLTRSMFVSKLREAIMEAGMDPGGFSGHSFRSGAATTAAARGLTDSQIKQLGRWKSAAYLRYIKPTPQHMASLSKVLAVAPPKADTPQPQEQIQKASCKNQ